jgi:hypothetical protein
MRYWAETNCYPKRVATTAIVAIDCRDDLMGIPERKSKRNHLHGLFPFSMFRYWSVATVI